MANIFVTRKIPEKGIDYLKSKEHNVIIGALDRDLSQAELVDQLKTYLPEAILSMLTNKIDEEVLNAAPDLKVVANYAVGCDNLDLKALRAKNIIATNTPLVLNNSVAEHTVALIFSVAKRVFEATEFIKNGKFVGWEPELFIGKELSNKNLTILGGGNIGMRVAEIAHFGLGMSIKYFDKFKNEKLESKCGAIHCTDLNAAIVDADVVSVHLPLLPETKGLLGKEQFEIMKKSAIFINTARGPIVSEEDLTNALVNGDISGAGLDVFEYEPKIYQKLLECKNAVLTPHTASATKEAREAMSLLAAENIDAVLNNLPPKTPIQ